MQNCQVNDAQKVQKQLIRPTVSPTKDDAKDWHSKHNQATKLRATLVFQSKA